MRFGVWHYLSGYVIIDIKGKNLERFLNRVVQSGGDIWRVRRTGSESVRACVSVATFYALRPIVRQCGVRISIAAKRGAVVGKMFPHIFVQHHNGKRHVFVSGRRCCMAG